MHTVESLKSDLARMGLKPMDTVLVHSSMKAIGEVEGRADGVLDALMAYFAPGLLALPTLTWEIEHDDPRIFDLVESKSIVGILPELFRKRPGVVRSMHPTHSLAAYGADAAEITARDHLNHTPCGPTSSWHRLLERDAHILMIGCHLASCTFLHGVEEWCGVPNRLKPPMRFQMVAADGSRFEMESSPHLGNPSEQYGRAERALREGGALTDGTFGDAKVLHLSAKRTFEIVSMLLKADPDLFSEERAD